MTRDRPSPALPFAVIALALLAAAQTGAAWHWEDERENRMYNANAGDPRVLQDAGDCLNETRALEGVSCVVAYPHLFSTSGFYPLNVQRPADCVADLAQGKAGLPIDADSFHGFNQVTLFSSPGFVQYEEVDNDEPCGDNPRMAPRRGLGLNLTLAEDVNVTGVWYLSSDMVEQSAVGVGTGPDGEPSTGTMPCLSVEMTLATGRFPGEGRVIAQGTTTKTVISTPQAVGDHALGISDPCPGSDGELNAETVTEFHIDLGPAQDDILVHEGYHVDVRWYQWDEEEPAPAGSVVQNHWNLRTGPDHMNRIVLPLEDTIQVENISFYELDNITYVQTSFRSAFGSYDADLENLRLSLHDENGDIVDLQHLEEPILRYSIDHDGQFKPVNATYPWDREAENLQPGEYTFRLQVPNWQHTENAVEEHTFVVEEERQESPVAVVPLLLVVALAIALAGKRR